MTNDSFQVSQWRRRPPPVVRGRHRSGSSGQPVPPQHLPRTLPSLPNPAQPGRFQAAPVHRFSSKLFRAQNVAGLRRSVRSAGDVIDGPKQFGDRSQTIFEQRRRGQSESFWGFGVGQGGSISRPSHTLKMFLKGTLLHRNILQSF